MQQPADPHSLQKLAIEIVGNVSGVYFLYDNKDLVYIGQGWNCFLRVAEHTRKDSEKRFTHWAFIHIESEYERKEIEQQLRKLYKPKFNKI